MKAIKEDRDTEREHHTVPGWTPSPAAIPRAQQGRCLPAEQGREETQGWISTAPLTVPSPLAYCPAGLQQVPVRELWGSKALFFNQTEEKIAGRGELLGDKDKTSG